MTTGTNQGAVYRFGPFALSPRHHLLARNDHPMDVPYRVCMTLKCLVAARGRVLKKDDLLKMVWPGQIVSECSLTRAVADLRKTLGDFAGSIKTVPGVGYQFVQPTPTCESTGDATSSEASHPIALLPKLEIKLLGVVPFATGTGVAPSMGARCADIITGELGISMLIPVVAASRIIDAQRKDMSVTKILANFALSHLLEGRIEKSGRTSSMHACMSNAKGRVVWAAKFTSRNRSYLSLASEVTLRVRQSCRIKLQKGFPAGRPVIALEYTPQQHKLVGRHREQNINPYARFSGDNGCES